MIQHCTQCIQKQEQSCFLVCFTYILIVYKLGGMVECLRISPKSRKGGKGINCRKWQSLSLSGRAAHVYLPACLSLCHTLPSFYFCSRRTLSCPTATIALPLPNLSLTYALLLVLSANSTGNFQFHNSLFFCSISISA